MSTCYNKGYYNMMKAIKKIISYIMILTLLLGISVPCEAAQTGNTVTATTSDATTVGGFPQITSTSAIVIDAQSGQIIYEKNSHTRQYPASITKILTAYLAITNGDLNATITMSDEAVWGIDRNSSHIALDVGEQISMSDALYAVMLMSANEAAWAIAEQVSGSLENFVQLMNDTARSLGCKDTHFTNANGLHDPEHYTTAYDMALITKQALTSKTFCEYASETYHEIPPTNKNSETRYLTQGNRMMLSNSEYYYSACQGGKTGYTDDAGGTLVIWAEKNDMQLICVTMGAPDNGTNYNDTITLLNYIYNNFSNTTLLSDYEFDAEEATKAQDFLNKYYGCENLGTMHLSVDNNQPFILANNADREQLQMDFVPSADRLEEGYIGTLEISYEGSVCLTLPVSYSGYVNSNDEVAVSEAYKNGGIRPALLKEKKSYVKYIIIGFIVLGILALFIYANVYEPRKRKNRRNPRSRRR